MLGDNRRDVRGEPATRVGFVDDQQMSGLADRLENRVFIARAMMPCNSGPNDSLAPSCSIQSLPLLHPAKVPGVLVEGGLVTNREVVAGNLVVYRVYAYGRFSGNWMSIPSRGKGELHVRPDSASIQKQASKCHVRKP